MLNLYAIREVNSGAWCVSSKYGKFLKTFDKEVAIFKQAKNARLAVIELNKHIAKRGWKLADHLGAPGIYVDFVPDGKGGGGYVQKTPVKLEVVVLNVTPQQ